MGTELLTSRSVIGDFYETLDAGDGLAWVEAITNLYTSNQASESYPWLDNVPQLREWIGGRNAKGFSANGIDIENRHFESTIQVPLSLMRRDKTDQVRVRIQELAERTNSHWPSLVSTLIRDGESTLCYDGQFFFDTDHSEGASGTQSNIVSVDISALPTEVHGVVTNPSVEEMQLAIGKGIERMVSFLDNEGEPINEGANSFLVMTPTSLMTTLNQAVATPVQVSASQTALTAVQSDFSVRGVTNPRLTGWTDKFAIFRTNGAVRPFIRQQETEVDLKVKAEGSEFEFDNDAHQYGVDTWRNAGNGRWHYAVLVQLT